MNDKEQFKLKVVKMVLNGECTKKEAAQKLGLCSKQVSRLIKRYKEEGEKGLIHKNKEKESKRKISDKIKEEIINLYVVEYYDYNYTHFYEEIKEKYTLSYKTVVNILKEADLISPESQRKTIKLYNTEMKKSIKEGKATHQQIEIYEKRKEEEQQKYIRRSSLQYNFGEEVQMDATFAIWYGNEPKALHLAVDKATKKVLYGWIEKQETTRAYYILLMNVVVNCGIPKRIKTDKRGTFSLNNVKLKDKLNTTQFGRICNELNITLTTTSVAVSKAAVERENKTFKGRLIAELRHNNITTDEDANKYLNNVFIPKINDLFSHKIDEKKNDIQDNQYSEEELNIIISEHYDRKIDNASSVKYKGKYYVPVNIETGEILSYKQNTLCTIIIAYDYSMWCFIENKLHKLCMVNHLPKKEEEKPKKSIEEINRSKAHTPSPDHPWKNQKKTSISTSL